MGGDHGVKNGRKERKKVMKEIVATNAIVRKPPERRGDQFQ